MVSEIQTYKAETSRIKERRQFVTAKTKLMKEELKKTKAEEKAKEKKKKSWKAEVAKLTKRMSKPKRVLRKQQLHVNIPANTGQAPYIPTFMSHQIQEEKRSMFFS